MRDKNDQGGPAFPGVAFDYGPHGELKSVIGYSQGMSLRKYYAGQALLAIFDDAQNTKKHNGGLSFDEIARASFNLADAMVKASEVQS
jgi:hypothetical protein